MSVGLCKDCRWWNTEYFHERNPWGRCNLAQSEFNEPIHTQTLAVANDGEIYHATLQTRPDFGCVQFEAKETTDGQANEGD